VFALVAGFLALAAIGAAIGWTVTDTSGGGSSPVAAAVGESPSKSPTASSSPTPPPDPTSLVIPDFAKQGTDFITARQQLIGMKLGVLLVFSPSQGGTAVVTRTNPAANATVSRGVTVKVYVSEAPPLLDVPNVVGSTCSTAGKTLAAAGFTPHYASGKDGMVTAQDPTADDQTAHWNDTVALACGTPPASPPASPSDPPSISPSPIVSSSPA
jgi:hypothetical protein